MELAKPTRAQLLKSFEWLLILTALIGGWRNTFYNGQDFAVMWKAARAVLDGQTPYSVARDGAMAFKYPPWIIPFFLPLAVLPLALARALWATLEVGAVLWIRRSLFHVGGFGFLIAWFILWGAWMAHTLDGQVSLLVLAVAVGWGLRWPMATGVALTTKIHTWIPWLIFRLKSRDWSLGRWARFSVLLLLLSIPVAKVTSSGFTSFSVLENWKETASSGSTSFEGDKVHGVENSGFTPTLVRILNRVTPHSSQFDAGLGLVLGLALSLLWSTLWAKSDDPIFSLGLLALVPTYHPLPWNHLFLFLWPLLAIAWNHGLSRRSRHLSLGLSDGLLLMGSLLFAMSSPKVFEPLGSWLALSAGKSWGVLLILGSILCESSSERKWAPK